MPFPFKVALLAMIVAGVICLAFAWHAAAYAGERCRGIEGVASWYGPESGHTTANGERFRPDGLTAASPTLPFNTRLRVTSMANGRSVVVRINDRGPFVRGRFLDLSRGAARRIGLSLGRVCVEAVG